MLAVASAEPQTVFAGTGAAYTAAGAVPYPYAGYYGARFYRAGAYPYYNGFAVSCLLLYTYISSFILYIHRTNLNIYICSTTIDGIKWTFSDIAYLLA